MICESWPVGTRSYQEPSVQKRSHRCCPPLVSVAFCWERARRCLAIRLRMRQTSSGVPVARFCWGRRARRTSEHLLLDLLASFEEWALTLDQWFSEAWAQPRSRRAPFTRLASLKPNSAQMNWIVLTGGKAIQHDSLVGDDADRPKSGRP